MYTVRVDRIGLDWVLKIGPTDNSEPAIGRPVSAQIRRDC